MQRIYANVNNGYFDIYFQGNENFGYYDLCAVIPYWTVDDLKFMIDRIYPFNNIYSKSMNVPAEHLEKISKQEGKYDDIISTLSKGISKQSAEILFKKIIKQE